MAWVKAEYADEFGVLSTWLAVLLPWTVSYTDDAPLESLVVFFRFGAFELQLRFPARITLEGMPLNVRSAIATEYSGRQLWGNFYADLPPLATAWYDGALAAAYGAWTVVAVLMAVAFALSLAMYLREEETRARLPVRYPRLVGALLGASTALLAVSTALLATRADHFGVPVPVGLLVLAVLSYALLTVDLVPEPEAA